MFFAANACWHSPAIAELLQQVVLLDGQPLIEAVHNPTVAPHTHAGLEICMLVAQLTCRLYVLQERCMHSTWSHA